MIEHCKQELPLEACGILSGAKPGRCDDIWEMKNIKKSTMSFEMSQEQIDRTFKLIEEKKQVITGIYHSHPTGLPLLSSEDKANAHYPEAAYFVISFSRKFPQVKCFHVKDKKAVHMKLKIIKE